MCNCCNGIGYKFESHGMKCKIVIRENVMSVCLPWNSVDLEVKVCPLCGRILASADEEERKVQSKEIIYD